MYSRPSKGAISLKKNSKVLDTEIEEALGSSGRIRILKFLIKNPKSEQSLSVFRLRTLTGLRGKNVEKHLETLVKWSWVEEIGIDGGKKYRLRRENPKVEALIEFFKNTGYI